MANQSIVMYKEFEVKMLKNMNATKNKAGGTSVPILYNGMKNVKIQTPILSVPFGMSEYTPDNGAIKYSMDLSFKNHETDSKIRIFMDKMNEFDNHLIEMAVQNSPEWFGKQMSKEVVEELYRPLVKPSKQPDKYAPTLKLKVRVNNNEPVINAFDTNKQVFDMSQFTGGTEVKAIVDIAPIWFVNKQFGTTLTLLALEIHHVPSNRLTAFAFQDEDDEEYTSEHDE